MLLHLLATGLFSASGFDGTTEVGAVIATADRSAVLTVVQAASLTAALSPLGAAPWPQQYDPGDHAPYAIDWTALLAEDEKIAEIEAIKVTSAATLLGIGIDLALSYAPIIDQAGKKTQVWFLVDQVYWEAAAFAARGVQLPITLRVRTDANPPKRYERTAVLTVRQL